MMHKSRNVAVMMLVGSLVVGAGIGYTTKGILIAARPLPQGTNPTCAPGGDTLRTSRWRMQVYEDLELTPVQRAQWDSLLVERNRRNCDLRLKADTVMGEYITKVRQEVLTAEQRTKLDSLTRRPPRRENTGRGGSGRGNDGRNESRGERRGDTSGGRSGGKPQDKDNDKHDNERNKPPADGSRK